MKSKPLILLGTPRSGTTHIVSIFRNSSQICAHNELFNNNKIYTKDYTSIRKYIRHFNLYTEQEIEKFKKDKWKVRKGSPAISFWNGKRVTKFKKKNQELTHNFFWDQCDNEYFFYKILHTLPSAKPQVSYEFMDSLCRDEGISKILIKRDPVHSYISRQKAREIKRWGAINTTNIKPHISLKNLYNHYVSYMDFYEDIEEKSKSIIVIDYDEIHKLADDEQKKLFLIKKLETIGVHLKGFELEGHIMTRQDMNTSIKDKIKNGDQVCEFLDSKNIKYQ